MTSHIPVGERIRQLRKKLKLTQAELAGSDFTKSFISQVEKGQTSPSLKSLSIIASRLGVPLSHLLGDEDEHPGNHDYISHLERARIARKRGDPSSAIEFYLQAAEACAKNNHSALGLIYYLLADVRIDQCTFGRAAKDLELAIEHLQLSYDVYNLARAYNLLGHVQSTMGQHNEACDSFRRGLELIDDGRVNDGFLEIRMRTNLGITLCHLTRYRESIEILEAAISKMKSMDSYIEFGRVCQTLGYACAALRDLDKAITHTREAIALYRSLGNWDLLGEAQVNLGFYLHQSGDNVGARREFEQVISTDPTSFITEKARAQAHVALAALELDEGRTSSAYEHLIKAFSIAPTADDAWYWTSAVVDCAERAPVPGELLALIEDVASKWKGDPRKLAEIHSNLGKIYSMMGDAEKANRHLSKSVDLFRNA